MSTILDRIIESKRREVDEARHRVPQSELERRVRDLPRPRNFFKAVTQPRRGRLHVIAEIKRASPSAGLLREDFDPAAIARTYYACGASALSVVTDGPFFQGTIEHVAAVKQEVPLPVLRKDFLIDPYQVWESRAAGADAILLIGEILTPQLLMDMLILANELNLTSLIEVHEAETLLKLRSLIGFPLRGYSLLGINNRNLRTQQVDLNHTPRLMSLVDDASTPVIAESGIRTREDVERMQRAGVVGVLIGETFMRAADMAARFRELFPDVPPRDQPGAGAG